MSLSPGARLGGYEVLAKLGEGGMGEVYRAHDARLNRDVALKVLPESVAADPDRLARFEREAKTLAALNHPNIAAIYGIEDQAIVMELVEGRTLDEIIAGARASVPGSRGLAIDEALAIARQILAALEAAHELGIVHRDLKPANIKVRDDGTVKVLDFGLAKALDQGSVDREPGSGTAANSPTMTSPALTAMGLILGTAAYMAPEQAKGKPVDERADIWAFGVVLFEMLTGRRPFDGDAVTEVLARVIERDVDLAALPDHVPPRLRVLIARCLEKAPRQRLHSIADARLLIDGGFDVPADAVDAPPPPAALARQRSLAAVATGAVLIAAAFIGRGLWAPAGPTFPVVEFEFDASAVPINGMAIAPDGSRVAFVGADGALYVRSRESALTSRLSGTEDASGPFFSPDGGRLYFFADGTLHRVDVDGGAPVPIARVGDDDSGAPRFTRSLNSGAFMNDQSLLIMVPGGLQRLAPDGRDSELLPWSAQARDRIESLGSSIIRQLTVLPGGETAIMTAGSPTGSRLVRVDLRTLDLQPLWPATSEQLGAQAQYLEGGHLVFSEQGNLRMVAIDEHTGEIAGDVQPILDGVRWSDRGGTEFAWFRMSPSGDLVYVPGSLQSEAPVWVDPEDGQVTPIETAPASYTGLPLDVSPAGDLAVVATTTDTGAGAIWVVDLERFDRLQRPPGTGADYSPVWNHDGTAIAFTRNNEALVWTLADAGAPQPLLDQGRLGPATRARPRSWSRDGRILAVELNGALVLIPVGGQESEIVPVATSSAGGEFSPTADLLAYISTESGNPQVWIASYGSNRAAEFVAAGDMVAWSRDGRELYFSDDGQMGAVEVRYDSGLRLGARRDLWPLPDGARDFAVVEDGRFLMLRTISDGDAGPAALRWIVNWRSRLGANGFER